MGKWGSDSFHHVVYDKEIHSARTSFLFVERDFRHYYGELRLMVLFRGFELLGVLLVLIIFYLQMIALYFGKLQQWEL